MPVLFGGGPRIAAEPGRRGRRSGARLAHIGIALVGLVALALAGCSVGTSQTALAKNQVFTWPYLPPNVPATNIYNGEVLDPAVLQWANDSATVDMLYAGLVTFDSNLRVVGDAALSWDVDATKTVYTFHLRHNLKFSDGTPLTAADYAYSIDRALDPALCTTGDARTYNATNGPADSNGECSWAATPGCSLVTTCNPPYAAGYLKYILGATERMQGNGGGDHSVVSQSDDPKHGINVIDPFTLKIRLTGPYAFFLGALTYPTSYPVEKSLVDKYPGGLWVQHLNEGGCSGPFMVKSYDGGKQLRMVPNPFWEQAWGKNIKLSEVDRPFVGSIESEYAAYQAGQFDFSNVPGDKYRFARGQDDFVEVPTLVTQYFGLNLDAPPFGADGDSILIRRAFDLALNKQFLVDSILDGAALPTNHIVPHGMPGFNDSLLNPAPDSTKSITGNAAAANSLLQQAKSECKTQQHDFCPYIVPDASGKLQPITFWVSPRNQTRVTLTQAAVQQWNSVLGLNVQVNITSIGVCLVPPRSQPPNPCQAWAVGWLADYPDPQDFLSLQFHTGVPNNAQDLRDSSLDSLMEKADVEQTIATRMQEYNKAEQQVIEDCSWIPYSQDKLYWRQRPWVHGFGLNPLQLIVDTSWSNVYISAH